MSEISSKKEWDECEIGRDLLSCAMRRAGTPGWSSAQEVAEVLCDIVEPAIRWIPAGEIRPANALEVVRRWCAGEATVEQLRAAAAAAYDVYASASAASAAAYAAYAVYATANASVNAYDAAAAAAYDAHDVYAAAYAYAYAVNAYDAAAAAGVPASRKAELIKSRLTIGDLDA